MQGFKTLAEGERVEFETTQGPKGPKATNVRKIS
jgi:CspA family cold shock protein